MSRAIAPLKTGASKFTDDKQLKDLSSPLGQCVRTNHETNGECDDRGRNDAEPTCENVPDNLIRPLLALSKSTRQLISLKLAEIGVVAGQDQLLDAIDPDQRRGICEIARELSVRPSTVSKMLDSLERRGWCRREMDDADLRRTFVVLTEDGARVRSEVRRSGPP